MDGGRLKITIGDRVLFDADVPDGAIGYRRTDSVPKDWNSPHPPWTTIQLRAATSVDGFLGEVD